MVSSLASRLSSLRCGATFSLEEAAVECKTARLCGSISGEPLHAFSNRAFLLLNKCAPRSPCRRSPTLPGVDVMPTEAGLSSSKTSFGLVARRERSGANTTTWIPRLPPRKQRSKARFTGGVTDANVSMRGTLADRAESQAVEGEKESQVLKIGEHGRWQKHTRLQEDEHTVKKQTVALSERLISLQLPGKSQNAMEAGRGMGDRGGAARQKAWRGGRHTGLVQAGSASLTPAEEKQALKAFAQKFQALPADSPLDALTPLVKDLGLALTPSQANQVLERLQDRRRWQHALMLVRWMEHQKEHPPQTETYAKLFAMLAEAGQHEKVVECYQALKQRNGVRPDHRNLLRIFGQGGCLQAAREVLNDFRSRGVRPDVMAYNHVINACAPGGHVSEAEAVLREMEKEGLAPNGVTYGTMIEVMGRGGKCEEAVGYFERYVGAGYEPTGATYKKLVQALAAGGQVALAEKYLLEAKSKGLVPHAAAYSALARAHAAAGDWRKGVEVLKSMPAEALGRRPMVVSLTGLIVALYRAGRLGEGLEVLEYMHGADYCAPNLATYSTIANALIREGEIEKAEALIQVMRARGFQPDVRMWGALLSACARKGLLEKVRQLLLDMKSAGCEPDVRCFETLVKAYVTRGRVSEGLELLTGFGAKGIPLRQEIYATLMEACVGGVNSPLAKGIWDHALAHLSAPPSARLTAAYMEALLSQGLHDEALSVFRRFGPENGKELDLRNAAKPGLPNGLESNPRNGTEAEERNGTETDSRNGTDLDSRKDTESSARNGTRLHSRLYALAIAASGGGGRVSSEGVLGIEELRTGGDGGRRVEGFLRGESLLGSELERKDFRGGELGRRALVSGKGGESAGEGSASGELERDCLWASDRGHVQSVTDGERSEGLAGGSRVGRDPPESGELGRGDLTESAGPEVRRLAEGDGVNTPADVGPVFTECVLSGGGDTRSNCQPQEGGAREHLVGGPASGQPVESLERARADTWPADTAAEIRKGDLGPTMPEREDNRFLGKVGSSQETDSAQNAVQTGRENGFEEEVGVTQNSVTWDSETPSNASPAVRLYREVLHKPVSPSMAVFLALLQACRKHGELREALEVPDQMVAAGLRPKIRIYNELLLVCSAVGNWAAGVKVKERMVKEGVKPDRYTFNVWIRFAGRCQKPDAAVAAFEEMPKVGVDRTLLTWNVLIGALGAAGRWRDALARFRGLPEGLKPSVVTYGIVVRMLARFGRIEECLEVLEEMGRAGFAPDVRVYNALGEALYVAQRWEMFLEFVQGMEKRGLVCNSTLSGRVRMVKKRLRFENEIEADVVAQESAHLSGDELRYDSSHRSTESPVANEAKTDPSIDNTYSWGEVERGGNMGSDRDDLSDGNERPTSSGDPDEIDTWQSENDMDTRTNGRDVGSVRKGVDWRWITGVPYRAPRDVNRKRRKEARLTGRHAKEWVHHTGRGTNEDLIRLLGSDLEGPGITDRESRHLERFEMRAPSARR